MVVSVSYYNTLMMRNTQQDIVTQNLISVAQIHALMAFAWKFSPDQCINPLQADLVHLKIIILQVHNQLYVKFTIDSQPYIQYILIRVCDFL